MHHARVAFALARHARALQGVGIDLGFVAQRIELGGLDEGRRDAGMLRGELR